MAFRMPMFHRVMLLVSLVSLTVAIRVDWNTNRGPIVPAIPTYSPAVRPPYREPAPVWEDQSNDIPNPNVYQYIAPPPSRPRPATNNYFNAPLYPQSQSSFTSKPTFGQVVSPFAVNGLYYNSVNRQVPSFGVQYVPNVGNRYSAVIPTTEGFYQKANKFNGKYNLKLKKYKAFEKVKLLPEPYYNSAITYQIASQQQQLPSKYLPQPFRAPSTTSQPKFTSSAPTTPAAITTTTTTATATLFNSKNSFGNSLNSIASNSYKAR